MPFVPSFTRRFQSLFHCFIQNTTGLCLATFKVFRNFELLNQLVLDVYRKHSSYKGHNRMRVDFHQHTLLDTLSTIHLCMSIYKQQPLSFVGILFLFCDRPSSHIENSAQRRHLSHLFKCIWWNYTVKGWWNYTVKGVKQTKRTRKGDTCFFEVSI